MVRTRRHAVSGRQVPMPHEASSHSRDQTATPSSSPPLPRRTGRVRTWRSWETPSRSLSDAGGSLSDAGSRRGRRQRSRSRTPPATRRKRLKGVH